MAELKPRWQRLEQMATDMQNQAKDMKAWADSMHESSQYMKSQAQRIINHGLKLHTLAVISRDTPFGDELG